MDRDQLSVDTAIKECASCGKESGPVYHGDSCNSVAILVDDNFRCTSCGALVRPSTTCDECGGPCQTTTIKLRLAMASNVDPQELENEIHMETNIRREKHGLDRLSYNHHLQTIAQYHSRDMSSRGFFSHQTPEGTGPDSRYRQFGHADHRVGENLAMQEIVPTQSVTDISKEIVDGWMESPQHRENILQSGFESEGLGVVCRTDGTVYITQNFH